MRLLAILGLCLVFSTVAYAGEGDERICDPCFVVDGAISPTNAWQTILGETVYATGNIYAYYFCAAEGTYDFTFCMEGGWADFDTGLSIQGPDNCGAYIACNDDYCFVQSEVTWFCPAQYAGMNMIVSVDGFGSSAGNYSLAYRGPESPSAVEQTGWGKIKMLYR